MGAMSPWHWAIVLIVVVLLFGSKRLPDAARGVGRSLRIFKSEMKEMTGEEKDAAGQTPAAQLPAAAQPAAVVVPPVATEAPAKAEPVKPSTETPGV